MLREWLHRWLPKGSFLGNVTIMTSGTVLSQGLMIAVLPVLTRIYSPADFSILAVYVAVIGFISVFSCMRYNIAIPLPEDDADGMTLLVISLAVAAVISLMCALPILFAPHAITALLGQPNLQPVIWLIPIGVFFASVYNALQYWTSRKKRFHLIAKTRIIRSIGGVGTQLGCGVLMTSPLGLIFGQMVYGSLGVWGLARDLIKLDHKIYSLTSLKSAMEISRRYIEFPIRSIPAALFDAGYQFLPILILARVLGAAELGVAYLVMLTMGVPISLLGSSISQVYLADAGERWRSQTLGGFTRLIMLRLFGFGMPIMVATAVALLFFSSWIFSSSYLAAGQLAILVAPWFIMQLTCSPVSSIFIIVNLQKAWLHLQFVGFVVIVGGTWAATILYPEISFLVFAVCSFIHYTIVTLAIVYITYKYPGAS